MTDLESRIASSTRKLYDDFCKIRGLNKSEMGVPFWDVVVLTTGDEAQKQAFQLQIDSKLQNKEIPSGVDYLVFSDPPGPKSGSGGSTLFVVSKLYEIYGQKLEDYRVLLLNAGGQSKRFPSASVLGKLFTALPLGDSVFQVLDLKLACYLPLLEKMKPGIFHAASDTVEVYDLGENGSWTFERPGFTAFAHPSSLKIGTTHGVFVLDPKDEVCDSELAGFRNCLEVLQKPTISRMQEKSAVLEGDKTSLVEGEFVYTDSLFYFDHQITKKFHQFYLQESPLMCEIDSYGDFLQALGPNATIDYACDLRNISQVQPVLVSTRKKIFNLLKGTPLNVIALKASKFYHLGTAGEYLEHLCGRSKLAEEIGFQAKCFNAFCSDDEPKLKKIKLDGTVAEGSCVIHSYMPTPVKIQSGSVVEYCYFRQPVEIDENCIISNCQYLTQDEQTEPVVIPSDLFLHTVPIKFPQTLSESGESKNNIQPITGFVTVVTSTNENFKKKSSIDQAEKMTLFNGKLTLKTVIEALNIAEAKDLFVNSESSNSDLALWDCKLFPVLPTMTKSFEVSLQIAKNALKCGKYDFDGVCSLPRVSMHDILLYKDSVSMLTFRNELSTLIKSHGN